MSHAEVCPVCAGTGIVDGSGCPNVATTKTCHGCGGSGWVTVQDQERVNTDSSELRYKVPETTG